MLFRSGFAVQMFVTFEQLPSVDFYYEGDQPITVTLRDLLPEERKANDLGGLIWCGATAERRPTRKMNEALTNLAERRLPLLAETADRPEIQAALESISGDLDENGRLKPDRFVPATLLPNAYRDYTSALSRELYGRVLATLRTIRWRFGLRGADNPIVRNLGMAFSIDGTDWHLLPLMGTAMPGGFWGIDAGHITPGEIELMEQENFTEPLAHQLYREAWALKGLNRRSALVMGMAAAEIAFKQFVSDMVPDAAWLMLNMQSPSLERLLTDYLPQLPTRLAGHLNAPAAPKHLVEALRKGAERRNEVAHRTPTIPDIDTLDDILSAVSDLLWLLDLYRGAIWAVRSLSIETRKALQEPLKDIFG